MLDPLTPMERLAVVVLSIAFAMLLITTFLTF
jgi:hypothetical protein